MVASMLTRTIGGMHSDLAKRDNFSGDIDECTTSTGTIAASSLTCMNDGSSLDMEHHQNQHNCLSNEEAGGSSSSRLECSRRRLSTDDDTFALVFDRTENQTDTHRNLQSVIAGEASPSCEISDSARVNNILDGTVKVRNLLDGTTSVIQDGPDTQQVNLREVIKAQMQEIERIKNDRVKDRSEIVERIRSLESSESLGFRRISGKLVIVGSAAIGKTSLVNRFIHDDFAPTSSTIACDSYQKAVRVDDALVNLLVYDTAGQERFAGLTAQYFRLGDACLICVDLSKSNCIQEGRVEWWLNEVKSKNNRCAIVLVGTKSDLASEDEVQRAAYYAKSEKIPFFRTSAKDGYLGMLFYHVAESVLRRRADKKLAEEQLLVTAHRKPLQRTACCA